LNQGTIIRAAGGFFSVYNEAGETCQCRARGNLKRDNQSLMVGDRVLFMPPLKPVGPAQAEASDEGMIEELLPRKNCLNRPTVANVDQLVVIMSLKQPSYDWQLASRLLVLAEKERLEALLCLNKADLVDADQLNVIEKQLKPFPYRILFSSTFSGLGLKSLAEKLAGKCSVFAGPSGAGKSSILNALQPGLTLKTGVVSDKIKRGRHTTRQAELLPLDFGGSVVDTPGFTRLELADLKPEDLATLFPEFEAYSGDCAFRDCRHLSEPRCAIRQLIGKMINPLRYEHYSYFMDELSKIKEVY
jgi:ribosome biogenesis GTPase / thiamine phosphate phosphatase